MDFLDFRSDPNGLGKLPHMRTPETWAQWDIFWKAVDGHPLSDSELPVFCDATGRTAPRPGGYREFMLRKGRQAGWSQNIADRATWRAVSAPPDASGTFVVILAQDTRATVRTIFGYVKRNFEGSLVLRRCVEKMTEDTVLLKSGVSVAVYPCRAAALRGLRALAIYLDEFAWFMSTDHRPTDKEVLRSAWPCRAMTGGELGIGSSPYAAAGEFFNLDRRHFGKDDSSFLCYVRSAPQLNPLLTESYLSGLRDHDPESARAEIDGEFRANISMLFGDPEALDACVGDYRERSSIACVTYLAFADPSGGRGDSTTLAVAHREGEKIIVDAVRAWKGDIAAVAGEIADVVKSYGLSSVMGDNYGADVTVTSLARVGVEYQPRPSGYDKSRLYLELVAPVLGGRVTFPNDPALMRELRSLDRRRGFGGRDKVDARGGAGRDDRANAAAGAVWLAGNEEEGVIAAPDVSLTRQSPWADGMSFGGNP